MKIFNKDGEPVAWKDGDILKMTLQKAQDQSTTIVGVEVLSYVGANSGINQPLSDREDPLSDTAAMFTNKECSETVSPQFIQNDSENATNNLACLMTSATLLSPGFIEGVSTDSVRYYMLKSM